MEFLYPYKNIGTQNIGWWCFYNTEQIFSTGNLTQNIERKVFIHAKHCIVYLNVWKSKCVTSDVLICVKYLLINIWFIFIAHSEGSDVDVERFIQNLNEKISNGIYRNVDDDNDNDDGDDGNVGDDDNGHEDGEVDGDDDDDDDDDIIRNSFQRPPNSRLRFIRRK